MTDAAPAPAPKALLAVERVTKRFGGLVALSEVSFAINEGEIYGLIGPNGAGKTTLFNVLTGIYRQEEGTIRYRGEALKDATPDRIARLGIARTFQNIRLFNNLSALENVMIGRHVRTRAGVFGRYCASPARAPRRPRSRSARTSCFATSASAIAATSSPSTSRTATSGGWRSRAPSRPSPCCSRSTSRPRA
jgi:ABC-type branched-subunit amino acid transport system ATPase component